MRNQKIKYTIVEALMKVVDNAPTMSNNGYCSNYANYSSNRSYLSNYGAGSTYQQEMNYKKDISREEFEVWMKYVFSVLLIAAEQIEASLSFHVYQMVQNIAYKSGKDYTTKTIEISKVLLDYAKSILYS